LVNGYTGQRPVNSLFFQDNLVKLAPQRLNKPIWILMKKEIMGGSGISWTICKSFAPHSRQITTLAPYHSDFYLLDAVPYVQPTVLKH